QGDVDEGEYRKPERLRRQHGLVALDDAGILQRRSAARALRRRQTDTIGEVVIGQPTVLLQRPEQLQIEIVHARISRYRAILCAYHAQIWISIRVMHAHRIHHAISSRKIPGPGGIPMGPFPHDAPPSTISAHNPVGTDGFEFVEFAHPQPQELAALFRRMGYTLVAKHKAKNISLYRQGDINYVL